jgi:glyoxalase family protein
LPWWERWLRERGVSTTQQEIGERSALFFEDPEGQRLALIDDEGKGPGAQVWERSSVPAEHQIRGLGPIMMSVPVITQTELVLTDVMNMRRIHDYSHAENPRSQVHVFEMAQGGTHAELHVIAQPDLPVTRQGAGGVHHVAFRTPTEDEYHAWADRLNAMGIPNSGEIDRYWFRSLYFREPNGVLFEIATDGPGFAVDEDARTLGEKVVLPPFLEPHRDQIVANLKPID